MQFVNLIHAIDNYPKLKKINNLINKNLPVKNGSYELATMQEIIQNDYLLNIIRKQFKTKLGIRNIETGEIILELDDDYIQINESMILKAFIYEENSLIKAYINIRNNQNNHHKTYILTPNNVLIVNERSFIYNLLKANHLNTSDYEQNLNLFKIDVIQEAPIKVYKIPGLSEIVLQPESNTADEIDLLATLLKSIPYVNNLTLNHNEIDFMLYNADMSINISKEKDNLFILNLTMHDFNHLDITDKLFKTTTEIYNYINKLLTVYNYYKEAENDLIKFVK